MHRPLQALLRCWLLVYVRYTVRLIELSYVHQHYADVLMINSCCIEERVVQQGFFFPSIQL